jgi:hypothetical protein
LTVAPTVTGLRLCANCAAFSNDAAELERTVPGLLSLSSGQGDTRGDQGLCQMHDQWVTPNMTCARFRPRSAGDLR